KNRDRHEKDDRPERNDPSRYAMGWNNEKKKQALQDRRAKLVAAIDQSEEALHRADSKRRRLQEQVFAVKRLLEHPGFGQINTARIQRDIYSAEEQMAQLKKSSDSLKTLTQQLETIRASIAAGEAERDELTGKIRLGENSLEQMEKDRLERKPLLDLLTDGDREHLLQFQQRRAGELTNITLENLDGICRRLTDEAESSVRQLEDTVQREGRELDRSMMRIKNPSPEIMQRFTDWIADVQQLPGEREYADEYLEWLNKLQTENLPRFKKDFERLLHDTAVIKMGVLNEELEIWERKIKNSILTLNGSLSGINFNRLPDTYIQLGIRPAADTAIREFRHKLLNALPQAADWQQNSFEEKALHFSQNVQSLITSLDENESYRARVLDVRNWFEFWADEKFRETHELKKTYRQMGQLSGGEKAQLTYTILCSAIAYQFGITREGRNAKSLRFIAVDESFSNQDEEKATYLMELCKQLHLQLLVVTPSDKIQIVEDFIAHVHLVQRVNGRHSILFNMTKKELKEKREVVLND
ncbi:MAG TPA: SbcC/MukB-like Walker B domain-containing protein, partial [Puia sp.]|nr:SbcC/MukB-like Walker B domain-containing protein [Puia sp.]